MADGRKGKKGRKKKARDRHRPIGGDNTVKKNPIIILINYV